jgi:hypothetical protein
MKHLLTLLLLGFPVLVLGNAKVLNNAVLESEQVQAAIKGDTATVTGTYHFRRVIRLTKDSKEPEGVYFPVIVPKGATGTAEDFKLVLRLNGLIATNYSVVSNAPVKVLEADAYSVVWILASFPGSPRNNLNVAVQYEQKLLEGKFYYLPILELKRANPKGYEIHVLADRPIKSVGKDSGGLLVKGEREMVFTPSHLNMIIVATGKIESSARGD